jgi:hypothetical protein
MRRIILTASGGAFRDWPVERLREVTAADAVKHPNWRCAAARRPGRLPQPAQTRAAGAGAAALLPVSEPPPGAQGSARVWVRPPYGCPRLALLGGRELRAVAVAKGRALRGAWAPGRGRQRGAGEQTLPRALT